MNPTLRFACPHCGRPTEVPHDFAGLRGRCPGCREWVSVPAAGEPPLPSPPPHGAEDRAEDGEPAAPDRRPCPLCGEPIRPAAKKCRHCGEFLARGRRGR